MAVYNATPHHTTPHHTTPASALKFQPKPEHQESPLKHKLRTTLKQYPFIRYPFIKVVRPVKRKLSGTIHRAKIWTRDFCLRHEPFRGGIIRLKGYKECPLLTVYDYCREHDGIIRVYDDSCEYPARPLCRTREEFEGNIFAEPVMRPAWYIYVSKIHDAVIWGYEDLIYAGGCVLTDRKRQIQGNHYYISGNVPEIREDACVVKMPASPEIIEKGIDMVKMWSGNIYHFSYETISRLQLADALEEYRSYPLILDEAIIHDKWRLQLLEMMNIHNHDVVLVKQGSPYLVKELIYPSFLNWPGEKKAGYAPRMHTMAADYVRERVLSGHKPSRTYKNVYIVRGDGRRLLNEEEVIECLSRRGIEIVYQKSYDETLDAFMTADNIIGAVGSNMACTTFTKPGANIYVICPFEYQGDNNCFEITDVSRRKLHFIPADIHELGPVLIHTSFYARLDALEAVAKQLSR